ncbi:helix-turn-helix transcriptional regulator [Paenibacillus illinoisensis]|uniref:helix-turn-helix transcriptional regulator n=1 Tax=Paenibacillus illinoisensis TaxID=59845 RepID=UPI000FD87E8E|nr:AraC family transcriptional regulator [Paenibacillus illinoisensis]
MPEISEAQSALPPFILYESRPQFDWKGSGSLSLKTFRYGKTLYEAGHGHFSVDDERYLLLNEGQEYSLHIDSPVPVESFCVFFPPGFMEEICRNALSTDQQLLNEPHAASYSGSIEWIERTYPMANRLGTALNQFRSSYIMGTFNGWGLEEQFHQLAIHMLDSHREVRFEIEGLDMAKPSTREELYRRIYIGHEYICAYYNRPITLTETASIAHLSVNHFLRNYKKLFGITPHQYLTELRLQAAKRLLLDTDKPVTDVCYEVGFESLGSFSTLFSKRFHTSPSQLRAKR